MYQTENTKIHVGIDIRFHFPNNTPLFLLFVLEKFKRTDNFFIIYDLCDKSLYELPHNSASAVILITVPAPPYLLLGMPQQLMPPALY